MNQPNRTNRSVARRTRRIRRIRRNRGSGRSGFTLIEVIIVLAMLVIVLVAAYEIFSNILTTERTIVRMTMPEKVGEGLVSLIRRDLAGCFFKGSTEQLQNQVFLGIDQEGSEGPEDRIFFLTTVDPTPREDLLEYDSLRGVMIVVYFLEPNNVSRDYQTYTLYRKEITDFSGGSVLDAPGMNYAVYDKVRALNFEYYDGYYWDDEWSSEEKIELEAEFARQQAQEEAARTSGVERVSAPNDPALGEDPNALRTLPAAPVPTAVRISIEVYAAVGTEIFEKPDRTAVTRTFTSIVPILASRRVALEIEDLTEEGMAGGGGGLADADGNARVETFGAPTPGGPSGRTRGGGKDGGRTRGLPGGSAGRGAAGGRGARGGRSRSALSDSIRGRAGGRGGGAIPSGARGALPGGLSGGGSGGGGRR